MALSLNDLKKKRPKSGSSSKDSKDKNSDFRNSTPLLRKKLSPWDSISNLTDCTDNSFLPKVETSIINAAEPSNLDTKSKSLEDDLLSPKDLELTISIPNNGTDDSILEPSHLKPPTAPPLKENIPTTLTTHFSELTIYEGQENRNDTKETQIEHSSNTEVTQKNSNLFTFEEKITDESSCEIRYRSDTTSNSSKNFTERISDTEVTHKISSKEPKGKETEVSDTEVTQLNKNDQVIKNVRSDTEVTQDFSKVADLRGPHFNCHAVENSTNLMARSDTKVTQDIRQQIFVSDSSKEVTQLTSKGDTEVTPILTQKRHKVVTQISEQFGHDLISKKIFLLRGNSLKVFNFSCQTLLALGQNILPISYESLAHQTTVTIGSIKTTIKRLRDEKLLEIHSHGGGPGAIVEILITDEVLKIFARQVSRRSDTIFTVQSMEKGHKSDTQSNTNASSKLVSKNNTNLLTPDQGEVESNQTTTFPPAILNVHEIQIENLAKFNITRKQIQDIKNQKLAFTTESLQDFVDRFFIYASDFQNVRNIKSIPALFVKMAQLASKGEDPLSDIETESDRLIRELLERKKQERERRLNLQEELLSFEFEDWFNQLDPEKQLALVPENAVARVGSGAHRMLLREYYKNHIWPDKFRELGV